MNHPLEGIWSNCSSEDRLSRIQSLCSVACLLLVNVENPFGANYQDASGIFSIFNLIQYYRDRSPDLILTTPSFQQVQNSNNQFSSHFSWQGNVQVAGGNTAETVPYSIFGTVLLQYGAGYMLDRIEFTAYEVQLRKRPSRTLASSGGLRKKRQAFEPHAGEADPDVTTRSAGGTGRWTYSHSMGPTVPSVGSAINNPGAQNQETPTALSRSTVRVFIFAPNRYMFAPLFVNLFYFFFLVYVFRAYLLSQSLDMLLPKKYSITRVKNIIALSSQSFPFS